MMKYKKIANLTSVITGGTPSTAKTQYWDGGDIPWLQSGCCQNCDVTEAERYITRVGYDNSSTKMMPPETVMIALTGATAGKVGYLKFEACGNQSITGILPCSTLNQRFLFYYLLSQRDRILADCIGGAQPHISQGYVKNIMVPVPPLEEQERIVANLQKVISIIEQRNKQIYALDELIKARFVELFGAIKQEKPLGEIAEFVTVGIANSATHAYASSGIPMLRNQNIKENHLDDSDILYIKPEFAAKYESKKLKENDIIAMRTGYPGVACLVPKTYEGCQTFTTLIVRLKPDNNPNYVCSFINSDLGKNFIESEKVGVAQQNLGAKSLAKMPIKIAPRRLQEEFAEFLNQVDKSKVAIQKSLDETQLLFDSLMQEYFG